MVTIMLKKTQKKSLNTNINSICLSEEQKCLITKHYDLIDRYIRFEVTTNPMIEMSDYADLYDIFSNRMILSAIKYTYKIQFNSYVINSFKWGIRTFVVAKSRQKNRMEDIEDLDVFPDKKQKHYVKWQDLEKIFKKINLSDREIFIVQSYCLYNNSFIKIGNMIKLSKEGARYIYMKVITKIRVYFANKGISVNDIYDKGIPSLPQECLI